MLNKEQKEAISITENPLIVIAGPGTGKTTLITEKINNLIQTQSINENEILALTFTQKAAEEMSDRVNTLSGDQNAACEVSSMSDRANGLSVKQKPNSHFTAKTFHSFALELIENYSPHIPQIDKGYTIIEESSQLLYFIENLSSFNISSVEIKNNLSQLSYDLQSAISKIKDFGITLKDFEKLQFENMSTKIDLLTAYSKYEIYKKENNFLDFPDLLLLIVETLKKNEKIRKEISNKYKYILIDEFQDTNSIQFELIKLIAKSSITIVGDQKQSIYGFRGSNFENLNHFKSHFKDFKEIYLHQNYRSAESIINSENSIIKSSFSEKEILTSNSKNKGKISQIKCKDENSQKTFILEKISQLTSENPNKTIGILCRKKSELFEISKYLKEFKVRHSLGNLSNIFDFEIIKELIFLLKIIDSPNESNIELFHILSLLNIREETLRKISRSSSRNEKSLFKTLSKSELIEYENEKELLSNFLKKLNKLIELKESSPTLVELVREAILEFNFYSKSILAESSENIQALNFFQQFTQEFTKNYHSSNLSRFISICNLSKKLGISFETENTNSNIELLTIHQSKGKEFDCVLIPYLNERKFPNSYKKQTFPTPFEQNKQQHLDEELRLFFVAVSRAKEELCLLNVKKYTSNILDAKPSPFLQLLKINETFYEKNYDSFDMNNKEKIKLELIKQISNLLLQNQFDESQRKIKILKSIFGKKDLTSFIDPSSEKELIELKNKLDLNSNKMDIDTESFIYSVSQLQTFDSCPKKYMYQYIYKIPSLPKPYFDFGTTVHAVLEEAVIDIEKNMAKELIFAKAINLFEKIWISKGYENAVQELEYFQKGIKAVKKFIEKEIELKKEKRVTIEREKKFNITLSNKKIIGVIDRIDKVENTYEIYDYKTSNSMETPSKLKNNLQLGLYSLALKTDYNSYPSKIGLWYVIHDKIIKIDFNQVNIEEIKTKLLSIISEIEKKDFFARPSAFSCKFCDFNKICSDSKY